ncbi:hypothetical protein [Streptomyces sp. NPDC002205]
MGTCTPTRVTANGVRLPPHAYHWDANSGILTVTVPRHTVHAAITVTYH